MKKLALAVFFLFLIKNSNGQITAADDFIKNYAEANNFSGTILINKEDTILYQNSFGLANRQFAIPATNDKKYKIASITKIFTAVLILQLFEEGKLDINETINRYLPGFKGEGKKVRIYQLLNHTSGLANIDTFTSMENAVKHGVEMYQKPYTADQILNKYCSGKLVHEPGKVFDYNNADYIILGKIIESVSGAPYEEVLELKILQPLKMNNSGMLYQYNIVENLADTYFMRNDLKKLVNDLPIYIENFYAAGAMYSTAANLLKFANALFNYKLLKKETLDLMLKPGLDNYGYSVWVDNLEVSNKKYKAVKRPGSVMGANAVLYNVPELNLTLIILSNTNTVNLDKIVVEISNKLIE